MPQQHVVRPVGLRGLQETGTKIPEGAPMGEVLWCLTASQPVGRVVHSLAMPPLTRMASVLDLADSVSAVDAQRFGGVYPM